MSEPPPAAPELHPALRPLLEHMRKIDANVLYLAGDSPPIFRVNDVTYPSRIALPSEEVAAMADSFLDEAQRDALRTDLELNLAVRLEDDARFRVNFHYQRGMPAMVIRALPSRIHSIDELGLPPVLKQLASAKRGLIAIASENAAARSAIFAAMVDHRNGSDTGHILSFEDPIEFQHTSKQCLVTQREVGRDTHSYQAGLRNALRQMPDLIAVDELRDVDSMEALLNLAETGHACMATLYASHAGQALESMLAFFPEARHAHQRLRLSRAVRAVICARVVPNAQGGRALALQVTIDTPAIKQLISRGDLDALPAQLELSRDAGCCSFDTALAELVATGRVLEADAARFAEDAAGFIHKLERLRAPHAASAPAAVAAATLRLAPDPYDTAAAPTPATPSAERRTKVSPTRG
jgi:twitching motility protein PilU